jgi:hypothetical protein
VDELPSTVPPDPPLPEEGVLLPPQDRRTTARPVTIVTSSIFFMGELVKTAVEIVCSRRVVWSFRGSGSPRVMFWFKQTN